MRLIDADALKKKAEMRGRCLRPMVTAYNMCVSTHDIDEVPTIEAEPVRHGKWEDSDDLEYFITFPYRCSVCGTAGGLKFNYCPNCGAKMDGEKHEP